MSDLSELREDVRYIRDKVDGLDTKVDTYQLTTEGRLSKLEERAGIFGAIGGVIGAAGTYLASVLGKN